MLALTQQPKAIIESITGHKKLKKLNNVKVGNLKKKNRDHKKVPKQDEDILVTCKFYYI